MELGEIQRRRIVKLLTGAELKIELITETTILIKMTVLSHSQWEKCHRWKKAEEECCGGLHEQVGHLFSHYFYNCSFGI